MTFLISAAQGRCWADYRSGGFFMELGCHLADLSRHLMGGVRNVTANTLRLNPDRVTEDFTLCMLQFETGAVGSIIVSANHRTKRQGLLQGRILGSKGRIDFTIYPYQRALNEATMTVDHGKAIFVPDVTNTKLDAQLPESLSKVYPGFFDVYQQEAHAFLEAVRGKREVPITVADGRAAIEIILAAYANQGAITDKPNFTKGQVPYRADAACHPLLQPAAAKASTGKKGARKKA
jgi:predicted dehydrogenase